MSVSTVSATNIQDPSGQLFANGTWRLEFVPTYGTSGIFNDGGLPFTKQFGGSLDATGSFSQAGVARSDTIAPAGSQWRLYATPAVGGVSYQVLLNVNSPAFDATASINAAITNIIVSSTAIARAYKDAELINADGAGAIYYDETLKVLKVWDAATSTWLALLGSGGSPTFNAVTANTISANAISALVDFLAPDGSAAAPGYAFTTSPSTGFFQYGPGNMGWSSGGIAKAQWAATFMSLVAGYPLAWNSGGGNSTLDTGLSRSVAGVVTVGNGTQGDFSGTLKVTTLNYVTNLQHNSVAIQSSDLSDVATLVTLTGVQTQTNKRITKRAVAQADATSITVNSDITDIATQVNTQIAGTLTLNAPTGTPTDGQPLLIRIKSTNAQTYSFNAAFRFSTTTVAPTGITAGKVDLLAFVWNATDSKWDVAGVNQGH